MNDEYLLVADNIHKNYGGIKALQGVGFNLKQGEVHALMGENGAGKSTLAKIIAGIEQKNEGSIQIHGKEVSFESVSDAIDSGVSIVLQEFNLIPHLTVAENLFLSHKQMYKWNFFINRNEIIKQTFELLKLFNMENRIHPLAVIKDLSVAQMQIIEILKAVANKSDIIILDEPTAALSQNEVQQLFDVINKLKAENTSFIIVSHRFNEIYETSDRITVFRDGRLVLLGENIKNITQQELIKRMVGREIQDLYGQRKQRESSTESEIILQVSNLTNSDEMVKDVSLSVSKGEIVGIAGLVGSGRSELVNSIFGADKPKSGSVIIKGQEIKLGHPKDAIKKGIALVPEDRKNDGLLLTMDIKTNLVMAELAIDNHIIINSSKEYRISNELIEKLNIKVGNMGLPAESLSGGNQQKVLLAKWLQTNPKVLIVDEPTRGIDISAKSEIYSILNRLADQGVAILMVSSELPEVIGVCDRVLVMRDGEIVKELQKEELDEERILSYASFA